MKPIDIDPAAAGTDAVIISAMKETFSASVNRFCVRERRPRPCAETALTAP